MKRDHILEKMRDDFKKNDIRSLKRRFDLGKWFLTEDDKKKVVSAIKKLEESLIEGKN